MLTIYKVNLIMFISVLFAMVCLPADRSWAVTYYVDYVNGSDSNNGKSKDSPWKHCPGDSNAEYFPASAKLNAGDRIIFKGGVKYRGFIKLNWSGSAGKSIEYVGNEWGSQKAIITGADVLTNSWTLCTSASDCGGNPNWKHIYYTTIPSGTTFFNRLYQNNEFLWFSQDPNPSDRLRWDTLSEWHVIPHGSTTKSIDSTHITDPDVFNQSGSNYWLGAYVAVWVQGNDLKIVPILKYNPSTNTISINLGKKTPYTDRDNYYTILNSVHIIDQEGEYAFDPFRNKIFLWPRNGQKPSPENIEIIEREGIFYKNGISYIKITGFSLMGTGGSPESWAAGNAIQIPSGSNIEISYCDIHKISSMSGIDAIRVSGNNYKIKYNVIRECFHNRGIDLLGGENPEISHNIIKLIGGTGILVMNGANVTINGNQIEKIFGIHANGLSIYSNSTNVVVEKNVIRDCGILFTFERSSNLMIRNNLFDGNGTGSIHSWSGMTGYITFVNNTMINGPSAGILNFAQDDAAKTVINNIIDGGGGAVLHKYNIYTKLAWYQKTRYGWTLGEGEAVNNRPDELFVNASSGDYRPRANGPLCDTGTEVSQFGVTDDILGITRPQGGGWDIGAYECVTDSKVPAPPAKLRTIEP